MPELLQAQQKELRRTMSAAGTPAWSGPADLTFSPSWRVLAALVSRAAVRSRAAAMPPARRRPDEGRHTEAHGPSDGAVGLPPAATAQPLPASQPESSNEPPPDRIPPDPVESGHAETWALVRRAQAGDGEAFGQLYDRYVDQVFRFVYYRVNDRALAEDFTSETFLRALRRIGTINYQGRDIGAWFMTIARNIVFDHAKSARFRLEISTGEDVEPAEAVLGPEAAVLAHLTNTRLLSAVNELNDEQKECIVLRFLQGLSVAETAQVMGKNDGAIKALQHRAVKRLAGMLAGELG